MRKPDFARLSLAEDWYFSVSSAGEKLLIKFPVRINAMVLLRESQEKKSLTFPLERLHIFVATEGAPLTTQEISIC